VQKAGLTLNSLTGLILHGFGPHMELLPWRRWPQFTSSFSMPLTTLQRFIILFIVPLGSSSTHTLKATEIHAWVTEKLQVHCTSPTYISDTDPILEYRAGCVGHRGTVDRRGRKTHYPIICMNEINNIMNTCFFLVNFNVLTDVKIFSHQKCVK
jgi:hypothetical protein